jgi:hypothetical protein
MEESSLCKSLLIQLEKVIKYIKNISNLNSYFSEDPQDY